MGRANAVRRLAATALVVLATGASPAPAADAEARVQTFLEGLDTLSSPFEQTLFDERMRRLEDSRGVMYLKRPDRFRWEYRDPFPQEIVGDGERVWIYDEELAQVTVKAMDAAIGDTPAALLSSTRPVAESFEVRDLGEYDALAWVGLKPRSAEATFADIRLGFDGEELRVMELVDNFGQTTVLRLTGVERNPSLDPDLFSFTPPPGADVVGP